MRKVFNRFRKRIPGNGPARRILVTAAAVVPVLACVAMVWFGASWYRAAHDDGLAMSNTRATVLRQAKQVAINLNTLNYRHVDRGMKLWRQSATGELDKEFSNAAEKYKKIISKSKITTEADVVEAAVESVNMNQHRAVVLIGMDVTVTPEKGESKLRKLRLAVTMQQTPDGWKASRVQPVRA